MINNYQIIDYNEFGIPFMEVQGDSFLYEDLYELVGCQQYMTTFNLKENSQSHNNYGEDVIGVIYYASETIEQLRQGIVQSIDTSYIRIVSPKVNLSEKLRAKLRYYDGVQVSDIENLIGQVLKSVRHEYKSHMDEKPDRPFLRGGVQAIPFNGDHYAVRVSPDGRLEQFYALKDHT